MIIHCSVHHAGGETQVEAEKLVDSKAYPGARFAACQDCIDSGYEPRPLVIIGAIYQGNDHCKKAMKYSLYLGEDIKAAEIML